MKRIRVILAMTAIMAMMSTGCGRQNGQTETPLPAQAASAQAVTAEDIEKETAEVKFCSLLRVMITAGSR